MLFLKGMLVGVPAIFFVGPVLLTLLQASIEYGRKSGLAVALGIAASDVVCVALAYIGVARYLQNPAHQSWLGTIGGCVIMGFGVGMLLSKPKLSQESVDLGTRHLTSLFVKGFLVNFVNPFVFAYWIGALSIMASHTRPTVATVSIYFGGAIAVILGTDSLKVLLAERLRERLTPPVLTKINFYAGIGLVFFGGLLIWRVW